MEAGKEHLPGGNKKAQAEKDLMEQQFQVGVISSTHGVRGEVKVFPTTDDVEALQEAEACVIRYRKRAVAFGSGAGEVF